MFHYTPVHTMPEGLVKRDIETQEKCLKASNAE